MAQEFIKCGYQVVEHTEFADVYVVNTCTVTNIADRKSRQMLRRVKEINPNAILVATGCYVQVAEEDVKKIKDIDLVIGNNEKKNIVEYVEKNMQEAITDVLHKKEYVEFGPTTYTEKTRAVIKVQDGCDRFCSYCIIPYARGRVRSRKLENVVEEINKIVQEGIQEVVITGIHIASYGKDFKENIGLIDLLEEINKIEGLKRIRLGSIEPKIITENFVNRLSKLEKICDHFHLSLQSGCDETLKRMNRRYTTQEFEEGTKLLRKKFPNASLTTDVIVGFPGETEEEFEKTYKFLEKIAFYRMHIFKYSQRKGTKAAVMPNQIDGKVKEDRSKKLIELSDRMEQMYNNQNIGKRVQVLFEEVDGEYVKGHTSNYIEVWCKGENLENKVKDVTITKCENNKVIGCL